MTSNPLKVRAKKASQPSNPDPIRMQAGDLLEIVGEEDEGWIWCRNRAGKESWVPLSYLNPERGKTRIAFVEYDATELPVEEGEEFQIEREESGWLWGQNTRGQWGWIRLSQVDRVDTL